MHDMNSLRDDLDDIMELFIGINYDLEKMRDAGYIEITDNLVILRDMLGKFQNKLASQKTLPRAGTKQKPKPLPKTPAAKKAPPTPKPKKSAAKRSAQESESSSESGSS